MGQILSEAFGRFQNRDTRIWRILLVLILFLVCAALFSLTALFVLEPEQMPHNAVPVFSHVRDQTGGSLKIDLEGALQNRRTAEYQKCQPLFVYRFRPAGADAAAQAAAGKPVEVPIPPYIVVKGIVAGPNGGVALVDIEGLTPGLVLRPGDKPGLDLKVLRISNGLVEFSWKTQVIKIGTTPDLLSKDIAAKSPKTSKR